MLRIFPLAFLPLILLWGQRPGAGPAPQPGETGAAANAVNLPIRRVVLYKNGVGYFEHLASIRDRQTVTISFTSGQLNDVLKTLTALDLGGGRVAGVTYGSAAPLDRRLGELQLPAGEKSSLTEFLGALRGARIEVRSGSGIVAGRLLSVERKTRISGGTTLEVDYLALAGATGEIRTTELSPSFSVRLLDAELAGKMERFLEIISENRETDVRQMTIAAEGSGERPLFVSYISEAPVWKATYRILLGAGSGKPPLLQGWAIVDNTSGQDWENVELSLVAGAPQSFIQNLSAPYYSRRPEVPMPEAFAMTPQTHQATLRPGRAVLFGTVTDPAGGAVAGATVRAFDQAGNVLAGETTTDGSGRYAFSWLPPGPLRLEVESPGFRLETVSGVAIASGAAAQRDFELQIGAVGETVEVRAEPLPPQTNSSISPRRPAGSGRPLDRRMPRDRETAGVAPRQESGAGPGRLDRAALETAALAERLGDVFEYKLKQPVTIRKNQSALVPIVQSPVAAEKVSIWNEQANPLRPRRGLWLTNSSGSTLDAGSFSVFDEEAFAGEGLIDPIRPGERRLISYALDLALTASGRQETEKQRVLRLRISRGVMTQSSEVRERKTYTFRNEDSAPRVVVIEHPARAGYELRGDEKPVETTSGWMRFVLNVPARQTASLTVAEARPVASTFALSDLTGSQVEAFATDKAITPEAGSSLRRIIAQRARIDELEGRRDGRDAEIERIFRDQQRLRENMKALKGSVEEKALIQRYVQQMDAQEGRLAALQQEAAEIDRERESEKAKLDRMIEELTLDVEL